MLTLGGGAMGQETAPSGSVTFGYRFTDVHGYQQKYAELFGLNSGLRVLDFQLFSKPETKPGKLLDSYSVTASGLGGEPFTTTQVNLQKKKVYDLRATFRQTHYYWDRSDATLPGGIPGLTANQSWSTVRKIGSVNLLVHATEHLRLSFEYGRNTRNGNTFTSRPIYFFGASDTWGAFARANPYYMIAPLNEETNRLAAGFDYTRGQWTVHYRTGFQSFQDAVNPNIVGPVRTYDTDPASAGATANELLGATNWSDYRRLTTPLSEFSYTGKVWSRVEWRGGYLFYRYKGPATLNMSADGTARTNTAGTAFAPYTVSMASSAKLTEPNHVLDQGATVTIKSWWSANVDYRYTRSTTNATADFRSVFDGVPASGTTVTAWDINTHMLDLNTTFTPTTGLLIRGGVRLMRNDVRMMQDGVIDPTRTKLMRTAWPVGSIYYEPAKQFSLRLDVDQVTNAVSYTRIMPHVDIGGRAVIRYRPYEHFYLEDTVVVRNRRLLTSDFRNNIRSNAIQFNFPWEKWSAFGGISYDSYLASTFTDFLRGPTPTANIALRDQTVSRVWQGGIRATPTGKLELAFTGNFVRTTGFGQIAGEAPWYGPMTFPYATASLAYDVKRIGTLALQLQRTYYSEQIVAANNFSANLLTILYTRSF